MWLLRGHPETGKLYLEPRLRVALERTALNKSGAWQKHEPEAGWVQLQLVACTSHWDQGMGWQVELTGFSTGFSR